MVVVVVVTYLLARYYKDQRSIDIDSHIKMVSFVDEVQSLFNVVC